MKGKITLKPLREEKYNCKGWPVFDKENATFENIVKTDSGMIHGEDYDIHIEDAHEFMVKLDDGSLVELDKDQIDLAMGSDWWDYYHDSSELEFNVSNGVASVVIPEVELRNTQRGFSIGEFVDQYGAKCSVQHSSIATKDCIWFGVDDPNPQIIASQAKEFGVETDQSNGWVKYPVPKEVLINTRMHLSREDVKKLLPLLQRFADTGSLVE